MSGYVLHLREVRLLTFKPLKVHGNGEKQVRFYGAFTKCPEEGFNEKEMVESTEIMPPIQIKDLVVMRVAPNYDYETLNVSSDEELHIEESDQENEEWMDYLERTDFTEEEEDWFARCEDSDWSEDSSQSGVGLGSEAETASDFDVDYTENQTMDAFLNGPFSSSSMLSLPSVDSLLLERSDIFMYTPTMPTFRHSEWNLPDLIGFVDVGGFRDDMGLLPRFDRIGWYEMRGTPYRFDGWYFE